VLSFERLYSDLTSKAKGRRVRAGIIVQWTQLCYANFLRKKKSEVNADIYIPHCLNYIYIFGH